MDEALKQFLSNPIYERLRAVVRGGEARIEQAFRIRDLPCRVRGRVDLVTLEDGKITIVDWKLSSEDAQTDDSLQLAAYALWARGAFNCPPEHISVFKAYLVSGSLVPFPVDARSLGVARARIIQDAERMAAMRGYGQEGVAAAFTASAQPALCRLCPYLTACPEGRECVYGGRN